MKLKKQYNVTQSDIDKGIPGRVGFCPIARCVKRNHKGSTVGVTHSYTTIDEVTIRNSIEIKQFVLNFDRGCPVSPFTFKLENIVDLN